MTLATPSQKSRLFQLVGQLPALMLPVRGWLQVKVPAQTDIRCFRHRPGLQRPDCRSLEICQRWRRELDLVSSCVGPQYRTGMPRTRSVCSSEASISTSLSAARSLPAASTCTLRRMAAHRRCWDDEVQGIPERAALSCVHRVACGCDRERAYLSQRIEIHPYAVTATLHRNLPGHTALF